MTLVLLYVFHWLIRERSPVEKTVLRVLSCVQLLLVTVIMVSAMMRMSLYVEAYGLTRLRFYSTAFMLWVAVSLGWFVVTALWGYQKRFFVGMVISGLLIVFGFHAANPNAFIASWNLGRVADGKPFDVKHALQLGPDAVPVLVEGLDRLEKRDAADVRAGLERQWRTLREADWRAWSWSRKRALDALEGLFSTENPQQ